LIRDERSGGRNINGYSIVLADGRVLPDIDENCRPLLYASSLFLRPGFSRRLN
jgi:hypothetical protein